MNRPEPAKPTTKPKGEVRPVAAQAEKESSCEDLLETILERENLNAAWKRVKQNGGAAGIDGMEIAAFRDFLAKHWDTILGKLRDGNYCPSPVRRVELIRFAHPSGSLSAVCLPSVGSRKRMARKGRCEPSEARQAEWIPIQTSTANPDGSGSSHPTSDRPNPDTDL